MIADFGLPIADLPEPGVDTAAIVPIAWQLIVCRRDDGSWRVSRVHRNPRLRGRAESGEGPTLEDALRDLGEVAKGGA